jgi:uncharacterized protein
MLSGWSKLRDVRKLADRRAALEFEISVAELPGMPPELAASDARVQVQLHFRREQGVNLADVALRGVVPLTCQRCLRPMSLPLDLKSTVAVLDSEADADAVPAGWETCLAEDGQVSPAALAAEELLLALPIVALHAEDCIPGAQLGAAASVERPFAGLRALMDRSESSK